MMPIKLSSLSIIVPTYREAENLPILLEEIFKVVDPAILSWEILIIDDNSRDGTVEACEKMSSRGIPVRLFTRKNKRGLATAVLEGFARATGDVFVVMDADLSHPPSAIPALYDCVQSGAEFAVGSRYISGGATDDQWTFYRAVNSRFASFLARPLTKISDPMSGFFALPRHVWKRGADISPVGYKIGLELIIKCRPKTILEIPIHFQTRRIGQSKLTLKQQLAYMVHVWRLYKYRLKTEDQRLKG
jgi:dolichol-phosphate mannosyltransferase